MNKKLLRKILLNINDQQANILKIIYHTGKIEIKQLAKITGYNRTTLQKSIMYLLNHKYVKRFQKNQDRGYCFYYMINDKGLQDAIKESFYKLETYKTQFIKSIQSNEEIDL